MPKGLNENSLYCEKINDRTTKPKKSFMFKLLNHEKYSQKQQDRKLPALPTSCSLLIILIHNLK